MHVVLSLTYLGDDAELLLGEVGDEEPVTASVVTVEETELVRVVGEVTVLPELVRVRVASEALLDDEDADGEPVTASVLPVEDISLEVEDSLRVSVNVLVIDDGRLLVGTDDDPVTASVLPVENAVLLALDGDTDKVIVLVLVPILPLLLLVLDGDTDKVIVLVLVPTSPLLLLGLALEVLVPLPIGVELEEPVSGEFEDESVVVRLRVTVEVNVEIIDELIGELEIVIGVELPEEAGLFELCEAVTEVLSEPVDEVPGPLELIGGVVTGVGMSTVFVVSLSETVTLEIGSVLLRPVVVLPAYVNE